MVTDPTTVCAESSFSASLHGSPVAWPRNCTHQLSTPGPAAAVAEQAAPVVSRRARNAWCRSTTLSVICAPRSLGQRAFAVEVAGLEPGERDVDHHRRRNGADIRPRLARQHVLAHGAAVGPDHIVRADDFLDGAVEQQPAAVVDVAVAAVGIGYAGLGPPRRPADGLRTPCDGHHRCDRQDSNRFDPPTHRSTRYPARSAMATCAAGLGRCAQLAKYCQNRGAATYASSIGAAARTRRGEP